MTKPDKPPEKTPSPNWPWQLAYGILLMLIAGGMIGLRAWLLQTYGDENAAGQWQEWKDDATAMSKDPRVVARKPPKAPEPPGLMLARDYFVVCFIGGMTLSAVLVGVMLLMLRGALSTTVNIQRDAAPKS